MGKSSKIHRASGSGAPLCGHDAITTDQLTQNNDEVTCGSCWQSMNASWGIELPSWVSPNMGGRKKQDKPKKRCSFCDKTSEEVDYLVEHSPALICDQCIEIARDIVYTRRHEKQLLEAKTDLEVNDAFDLIFDLVHDARKTGYVARLESFFVWFANPNTLQTLHTDLLLTPLRLTATMRHVLPCFPKLVKLVHEELTRRGEDADRLLWGLKKDA